MDSMGARRRARNLPAISLQWGPWADVGMAARAGTSEGRAADIVVAVVVIAHVLVVVPSDVSQLLLFPFLLFSACCRMTE